MYRLLSTSISVVRILAAVNIYICGKIPMTPVKVFLHGVQVYYSNNTSRIDKESEFRAFMKSPGGWKKWEEKVCNSNFEETNDRWIHVMATYGVRKIPGVCAPLFVTTGISEQVVESFISNRRQNIFGNRTACICGSPEPTGWSCNSKQGQYRRGHANWKLKREIL